MTVDLDALEALLAAATPGPWETDSESNDGAYGSGEDVHEGFKSYIMLDSKGQRLFDSLNSTAGAIEEDIGDEGVSAWDEFARRNFAFIAAARNGMDELLRLARVGQAAVDAREAERRIVTNPCRPMPIGDQSGLISEAIAARKRLRLLIDSTRAEAGR